MVRGPVVVAVVVALAVAQIVLEDAIVFLAATGVGPAVLRSPLLLVALPFVLFLAIAGVVWAWALSGDDPRYE